MLCDENNLGYPKNTNGKLIRAKRETESKRIVADAQLLRKLNCHRLLLIDIHAYRFLTQSIRVNASCSCRIQKKETQRIEFFYEKKRDTCKMLCVFVCILRDFCGV